MEMTIKKMIPHSRPWITAEDRDAISEVLGSGQIAQGDRVARFEEAFCRRFGYAGGVAAASGTTALVLTLRACGTGGGEVLLPSYVCVNVYQAVQWAGFRPILYDVDWNRGPSLPSIRSRLSAHTRAIIVDSRWATGLPAPMVTTGWSPFTPRSS
jgi:perosamine synthetase